MNSALIMTTINNLIKDIQILILRYIVDLKFQKIIAHGSSYIYRFVDPSHFMSLYYRKDRCCQCNRYVVKITEIVGGIRSKFCDDCFNTDFEFNIDDITYFEKSYLFHYHTITIYDAKDLRLS
jgi:hypothetical protein